MMQGIDKQDSAFEGDTHETDFEGGGAVNPTEMSVEQRQEMINVCAEMFQGPLPPPNILAGYEKVVPGAAERIIAMSEKEQQHRHQIDRENTKAENRDSLLGIVFAFAIVIIFLFVAVAMAFLIPGTSGAVLSVIFGVSGLAGVIAVFINGTRRKVNQAKDDN